MLKAKWVLQNIHSHHKLTEKINGKMLNTNILVQQYRTSVTRGKGSSYSLNDFFLKWVLPKQRRSEPVVQSIRWQIRYFQLIVTLAPSVGERKCYILKDMISHIQKEHEVRIWQKHRERWHSKRRVTMFVSHMPVLAQWWTVDLSWMCTPSHSVLAGIYRQLPATLSWIKRV